MTNVFNITDGRPVEGAPVSSDPLRSGGGGGTSGGMEERVSRLERQYERLEDKVGAITVNLATLSERVNHLPTKGFIVRASLLTLTVIGALTLFQDRLVAFLGTGQ